MCVSVYYGCVFAELRLIIFAFILNNAEGENQHVIIGKKKNKHEIGNYYNIKKSVNFNNQETT